jgi:3,4-dihydroxy 2-butanone 4-phosphate synthase/GTP cyclohydrolase II
MFHKIEEAIEDIKQGKMVIVVDDENRENEGDLIMAAEKVTPEAINFMISQGKGLVCVPMTKKKLARLEIPLMTRDNSDSYQTAFTISVDSATCKTGISAFERAQTIKKLVSPDATSSDFRKPGHIFPLEAKENGVLEREGHTEAAVDLAKLAGLEPVGIICEIIDEDGTMARLPKLKELSEKWNLKLITIEDLIAYRKANSLKLLSKVDMPTRWGHFQLLAFDDYRSIEPHLVLVKGDVAGEKKTILTRIHSECFTGDLFGSERCDCGDQLHKAMQMIDEKGEGVLLYLRQEGRGIGLKNKLKAYELQEHGFDTVEANEKLGFASELRDFSVAANMLKFLGVSSVELMTNNPKKIEALEKNGIRVAIRKSLEIAPTCGNLFYLQTKKAKMGHLLELKVKSSK